MPLQFSGKRLYSFVALPSWQELKVFLEFAGPIAFALLGKVSSVSATRAQIECFFLLLPVDGDWQPAALSWKL